MKKCRPKVSIVMVNFNGLRYLSRTIPALQKISYSPLEIILADNGSTDGSLEYAESMQSVIVVRTQPIGAKNAACNSAIEKATGEYILLIDNDALIGDRDILQKLLNQYSQHKKTGSIGLSFCDNGEDRSKSYGGYLGYYYIRGQSAIAVDHLKMRHGSIIGFPEGKGLFIKKSIWKEVGGYDETLVFGGDDSDLGTRLVLAGYNNYLFSESLQKHLGNEEKGNTGRYSLKWRYNTRAILHTILKDYSLVNMGVTLIGFTLFGAAKSLKQSIVRKSPMPLQSFVAGYWDFLRNINKSLQKRRTVQQSRVIKSDCFLSIRPQKQPEI